ncbi:DNA helicase RecQ [Marinisporobacter balticus]|uniref:DNA helicase RecQ n=1 Tax=Marinisporobacter balticus TaxID=2018667 RepID=A0A4R2KR70_9FIRM|nr:DNA helicase RecQ [Marinisporobacter balticus]TCO75217.1 RecQ-like ATP-dependent DNA helicase [Marinisporobacter balticus]
MLEAKKILKKYYGYEHFRSGQKNIIESILQGKDTFAIMPTGAGKSICFQIPALLLEGLTLVISPLISLMKDQVDGLKSVGIPATYINSALTSIEVKKRIDHAKNGAYKLLYVAPERLESEGFCQLLNTLNISLIAVDEAHCVSQWGHDFRPSYGAIAPLIKKISNRPIVAGFTATATKEVKEDAIKLLSLENTNVYMTGFDRENLSFTVIRGANKKDFVMDYIRENKEEVGIVYAATRKEVEAIYENLYKRGYAVGKYHAGLNPIERKESQEAFLYDDINIMIATNAFGMGIDKSNVRYVIHHNIPKNMEAYYQEAGRAGRDGEKSECMLLFSAQDVILQKFFIEQGDVSVEREKNEYKKLQAMVDYCHTTKCLRKYILEYFGEENVGDICDNCSNCKDDSELTDITIEAQKIFSCIYRMKERFGTSLVAMVLRGSKNKKVLSLNFDQLSTYGIMKQYTEKEIKDIMNILIAEGYLDLTEGQYPIVKLGKKAVGVLKNKEKVLQKIQKRKEKVSVDNSLFEKLRELRKNISTREKVPPYIIFADSTLREMSEFYPIDQREMLKIKGVGEEKLKRYGDEFLNAIKEYVEENGIKNRKIEHIEIEKDPKEEKIPSHMITFNMYKEGNSLKEIAMHREMTEITIQNHIIRCVSEGLDVDLDNFIPNEYESLIIETIEKIGAEKLKPIKEALPDAVNYLAIRAVLCKHKISI